MIVDQSDIHLIDAGRRAWIKVYGRAERTYRSRVEEVAAHTREEVPTELSNMAGGEVPSKPDAKTGAAKPISKVYEVIVPLENTDLNLEPGLRGTAKIDGGTYKLGWWIWRWANKMFKFLI